MLLQHIVNIVDIITTTKHDVPRFWSDLSVVLVGVCDTSVEFSTNKQNNQVNLKQTGAEAKMATKTKCCF